MQYVHSSAMAPIFVYILIHIYRCVHLEKWVSLIVYELMCNVHVYASAGERFCVHSFRATNISFEIQHVLLFEIEEEHGAPVEMFVSSPQPEAASICFANLHTISRAILKYSRLTFSLQLCVNEARSECSWLLAEVGEFFITFHAFKMKNKICAGNGKAHAPA